MSDQETPFIRNQSGKGVAAESLECELWIKCELKIKLCVNQ